MGKMQRDVMVAGVGMVPFTKPGARVPYDLMGEQAIRMALSDGGVDLAQVEQVYAGFVYGDSCAGQRVIYRAGMTGIPIVNVNNNCSTGSTALFLARQAVESGAVECVLPVAHAANPPASRRPQRFGDSRLGEGVLAVWRAATDSIPVPRTSACAAQRQ